MSSGAADLVREEVRRALAGRPSIQLLWLLLPALILIWMTLRHPLPELDFWWHLKAGELIYESGAIPRVDAFSFTAFGDPYVLHNWLSELIYYCIHRLGGLELLIALNTALLLLAFLPNYHLSLGSTRNIRFAAVGGYLVAWGLILFGWMRPHGFSILLFSLFYWLLERKSNRSSLRLFLLPILMVVWVNLHGAFVLGLALIGVYLLAESIQFLLANQREREAKRTANRLRTLFSTLLMCSLATFANPEGLRVWEYVVTVARDTSSQLWVSEWQAPSITTAAGLSHFFGPLILICTALAYSRRKLDLKEALLLTIFALFALSAIRNSIWFLIVAAPIFVRTLEGIPWRKASDRLGRSLFPFAGRIVAGFAAPFRSAAGPPLVNAAILCAAAFALAMATPWARSWTGERDRLHSERTPIAVSRFLEENGIEGKLFHHQDFGDYLIWRLWPQQKTFIDGRVHLFGEDLVRDYRFVLAAEGWEQRLDRYAIDFILLPKTDPASQPLLTEAGRSNQWRTRYEDERAVLFERAQPAPF